MNKTEKIEKNKNLSKKQKERIIEIFNQSREIPLKIKNKKISW